LIADNDHLKHVAEAFSYKALIYDEFGKDHPNLQRMRRKVYQHVLDFIKPGGRMLEINAGTGTDASFFAQKGVKVHATDVSPGMLHAIQEKIVRYGLQDKLSAELCSFTELSEMKERSFDYVFSNFGGLNCVDDLNLVAGEMKGLLRPGGRLTWVVMPPVCPWDLALAFKGEFHTAIRRLKPGGTIANVEGVHFHVRYFTPAQVLRSLGNDFRLLKLEGLSIFAPPADRKNFALRNPGLYKRLVWIDERISSLPVLRGWGDFFILSAEYRP
jgi:ubiquinone/menaquinone biosynthesis C-methylase UbiE